MLLFALGLLTGGVVWLLVHVNRGGNLWQRPSLETSLASAGAFDLSPVTARYAEHHPNEPERIAHIERDFRRFFAIAAASQWPVGIRSEPVDDYWHEAILFTRLYAKFSNEVAGRFFHHEPTGGSEARYARTWIAYTTTFGEEPDPALWPAPAPEFLPFFRERAEVVRQDQVALAGGAAAVAQRAEVNPLLLGALPLGIFAAAAVLGAAHPAERAAQRDGSGGCGGDGGGGDGGCGGGCGGGGS